MIGGLNRCDSVKTMITHCNVSSRCAAPGGAALEMQQSCPFGMSPARPPGLIQSNPPKCLLHVSPFMTTAVSIPSFPYHCQEREPVLLTEHLAHEESAISSPCREAGESIPVIPSELGRLLLEKSLRRDGRFSFCEGSGIIEFVECNENLILDAQGDQELKENRVAIRSGKREKSNTEISQGGQGPVPCKIRPSDNGCSKTLSSSSQENGLVAGTNRRHIGTEGLVHALERAEQLFSVSDLLQFVQKCRENKDLTLAFRLYQHICRTGLESDKLVGNHLVPMFVDCGDLLKASQVFRRLICQNEHSWSFLILGYCLEGNLQHALKLYDEMKKTNIKPSSFTFVGLLNACVANRNLEVGRSVHEEIKEKGFAEDVLVGNSLIDMYMKCGFLNEAEKVFEGLPVQDVVSWTALLAGYVEFDLSQEALTFYHKMQSKAISSNAVTMALAMKASRIVCDTDQGRIIHSEAVKKGYEGDLTLSNSILSLYAKCSCVDDAHYVFDKLPDRDVVSWNTMIVAHTEHGNFQEALECYEQMQIAKIVPDSWTMSSMLKVCASLGALEQGKELHNKSLQLGLADNVSVVNSLIDFYGRCGWMPESRMVFEKLVNKDVISWTALIAGYAEHGQVDEALDNFMKMQENGFAPNAVTYSCALKACCASGVHDGARTLHMDVVKMGLDSEETVINTLINVYATFGSLIDAEAVFERMPARCVVSWTALIGGYVDCGYNIDALKYFEKMQAGQISPNFVTYAYILKACGSIGAVEKGREFHLEIAWDGFESDPSVGSALINMYAQCGSLSEACEVFNDLLTRDITVWSSMMKAYALNHQGYDAVHCFKDMLQQGLKPDVVTFTCLLTACSHAGLIQEGLEYFKLMREKYGFAPTNEHYSCIVDLLGRSGELLEAEKFIETFTVTQEDAWAALLTACKTHGDVDLGMRCFEQLMQKDPEDAAWYTLMTDILTGAGRWEDALKIETFRKHVEAKKMPATAWIEIDRQVHRFMVGDEQNEDILAAVRALNLRLKDEGHVPNLNLDVRPVSDHKKEEALCEHAEKLAIAFGLLNTPQGTSLRVSKNLRMCADCHNASKIISRMERREIILRDDCCMHHFIDGSCVCGDMF